MVLVVRLGLPLPIADSGPDPHQRKPRGTGVFRMYLHFIRCVHGDTAGVEKTQRRRCCQRLSPFDQLHQSWEEMEMVSEEHSGSQQTSPHPLNVLSWGPPPSVYALTSLAPLIAVLVLYILMSPLRPVQSLPVSTATLLCVSECPFDLQAHLSL